MTYVSCTAHSRLWMDRLCPPPQDIALCRQVLDRYGTGGLSLASWKPLRSLLACSGCLFVSAHATALHHFPLHPPPTTRSCGLGQTRIMAKIENLEGLVNGSEILDAADAILLSRGNLGICLDPEKVGQRRSGTTAGEGREGKTAWRTAVVKCMGMGLRACAAAWPLFVRA